MLKKTITYKDYDGTERTEDFYFNISKGELIELNYSKLGGLEVWLRKIVAESDNVKLFQFFKQIIMKAYGEKSIDGKRFIKSRELSEAFTQTEAYSELIMELFKAEKAIEFVRALLPKDLDKVSGDNADGDVTPSNLLSEV